ncbi:MAG: PaaI family thioesterase [Pseudomonadota bacterium]
MHTPHIIERETGAQSLIGYIVDVSDRHHARCWLDVGAEHTNRHNVLHGGIATCLLDNASGTTGSLTVDASGRAPFLTVSLTVQFLAPGYPGRLTATGTVVGGGRSLLYIDAALEHENGTLIATSTGIYKRVPQERLT